MTDCYKIGPSKIHGNGIIAARNIEQGETIGMAVEVKNSRYIMTDMGKFVNHSYMPNSQLKCKASEYELVAIALIKADEEIVTNYNDNPNFLDRARTGFI